MQDCDRDPDKEVMDFCGALPEADERIAGADGSDPMGDEARAAAVELAIILPSIMKELMKSLMKDLFRDSLYSFRELRILPLVKGEPGMTMGYYSERLFMSKPNFSQLIDKMVNNGYLERKTQKRDRRTITLEITQKGEEKMLALRAPGSRYLQKKLSEYSDDDLRTLRMNLLSVSAILKKYHD